MTGRPGVVVLAKAPRAGLCKTRMEPLLGAAGAARLQAALIGRAVAWASALGDPFVAFTPDDAEEELRALAPAATLFPQAPGDLGARIEHATSRVLREHGGPVLLVGVDAPTLTPAHGRAALDDLADGVDVSFGPAADGGWYLVALDRPHPGLFALPSAEWGGPEVLRLSLEAAGGLGLTLGMLRSERDLDEPADAHALLADPLAPVEVVEALRSPR